jgi:AraC-like DNA-binding protein
MGLAPKEAGRVFRFTHARRRIEQAAMGGGLSTAGVGGPGGSGGGGTTATFARLAAECGFYDQAHLAREFRALAGCPPSQWLAEQFRFIQASAADLGE